MLKKFNAIPNKSKRTFLDKIRFANIVNMNII